MRTEFELCGAPITITRWQRSANARTASWRFCVEAPAQHADDAVGEFHRQRGLGDISQAGGVGHLHRFSLGHILHHGDGATRAGVVPAERALHLHMSAVPNQQHAAAGAGVRTHL